MSATALCIVDDDEAELELLSRIAADAFPDVRVKAVRDAETVPSLCDDETFDCVVLDYNMPGMDGLMCAQRVREGHPYLPIVLSTAVGDEMLAARALTSGVSDYIPKSRVTPETLRRVVENAIRVSSQARTIHEQRNELEHFAYALAHDFKQPLRQIRMFSSTIKDAIDTGRFDRAREHLGFLSETSQRLTQLVDVMSQYTLLNETPEIHAVDLGRVVASVRILLAPYFEERRGDLLADRLPIVLGNEVLLIQIIQNLVSNGLKYNESANPFVEISARTDGASCIVSVKDNGIGIERRFFERIFAPLERLHSRLEYPGTGLGLTLARKAVAAQGGRIWCESEPGVGSVFFVELPLAPPAVKNGSGGA